MTETSGNKRGVIGLLTDYVHVPFVAGVNSILGFLQTAYYHVHGASFTLPKYVLPIQLTSNSAAWNTTGLIFEIIAANAVTKPFDLHWISISDISANLYGIVDIYSGGSGSEVLIGSVPVTRTAVFSQEGSIRVQVPQQPANTRISCKFSDSTASAQTVRVKFMGHVYGTTL